MKKLLFISLIASTCFIWGCTLWSDAPKTENKPEDELQSHLNELQGPHYAKLNSIGCVNYSDMAVLKSGHFDTIDSLIREKRCFPLPTDVDILVIERSGGDIVKAKIKDEPRYFYTFINNLVAK